MTLLKTKCFTQTAERIEEPRRERERERERERRDRDFERDRERKAGVKSFC